MKQLANDKQVLNNIASMLNGEISVELLHEHIDTAISELCRYKITDTFFVGNASEFDTIQVLMSLRDALTQDTKLKKAS